MTAKISGPKGAPLSKNASINRKAVMPNTGCSVSAALMGSITVRLFHDHLLVKEPGTQQPTPWHQDQPYYNVDGVQNCSMWMPVDPVPLASTLEFLAGSHRGGWLMPRSFMDKQAKWFPEGTLHELPTIEGSRDDFDILGWALGTMSEPEEFAGPLMERMRQLDYVEIPR